MQSSDAAERSRDPLMVASVEKAFRVLSVFGPDHHTLGLSQITELSGLDKSAAQRFIHTLTKLGYLEREPMGKRWRLSVKTLAMGFNYIQSNGFVRQAQPYLLQLGQLADEACNLTVLDGSDIVFLSRYPTRHMLANDIITGSRMPAYCSASGIAMLAALPESEAIEVLRQSRLVAHTQHTTWQFEELIEKLRITRSRGYATCFDEYYLGDISVAAAVLDGAGRPQGGMNISVTRAHYTTEQAEEKFAPLIIAAAQGASRSSSAMVL